MENNNKIEVFLDFTKKNYSDATVTEEKEIIHREMMSKIKEIWKKLYEEGSVNYGSFDAEECRCHNTVSVFASRGAGKTTFMLTFRKWVKDNYGQDTLVLAPIDPSLIENKQHPFINLIAKIQAHIDEKDEYLCNTQNEHYALRLDVDTSYRKLIKALPFLDGICDDQVYRNWDDVDFISAKGMEIAKASNKLNESFHDYVNAVLKYLGKKVIFIAFDDIDTDFKKGHQILEVIRKYLNHPHIITLLTGDYELYSKLVRKASWASFDIDYLKKETTYAGRNSTEYASMIDQLENQYLVKILKPEHRIQLKTLREYLRYDNYELKIKIAKEDEAKEIEQWYQYLAELCVNTQENTKVRDEVVDFLLRLPLRVQIRVLTLIKDVWQDKALESGATSDTIHTVSDRLIQLFWNDINQKSPNAKDVLTLTSNYTVEMLRFLLNTRTLFTSTNFLPETNDPTINKSLFALGTKYNALATTNPVYIFDYWIRICYFKQVLERFGNFDSRDLIEELRGHSQIEQDVNLNKSIGMVQSFCSQKLRILAKDKHVFFPGVANLSISHPVERLGYNYRMSMLPLLGTLDNSHNETVVASIYHILGIIRDLVNVAKSQNNDELYIQIKKLGQYRNYREPVIEKGIQDADRMNKGYNPDVLEFDNSNDDNEFYHLAGRIKVWANRRIPTSVQFLDRVFTRFYYTLINIDNNDSYENAAEAISQYILALMNASIVEESIDCQIKDINLENTGDINIIFAENYQRQSDTGYSFPFFKWLFGCPLLRIYINPYLLDLLQKDCRLDEIKESIKYFELIDKLTSQQKVLDSYTQEYDFYKNLSSWYNRTYLKYKDLISERDLLLDITVGKENNKFTPEETAAYVVKIKSLTDAIAKMEKSKNRSVMDYEHDVFVDIEMDKDDLTEIRLEIQQKHLFYQFMKERMEKLCSSTKKQISGIPSIVKKQSSLLNNDESSIYNDLRNIPTIKHASDTISDMSRQ